MIIDDEILKKQTLYSSTLRNLVLISKHTHLAFVQLCTRLGESRVLSIVSDLELELTTDLLFWFCLTQLNFNSKAFF